jgi:hypothetical protein
MGTAAESLEAAASRLDEIVESARHTASLLDTVSAPLVDRAMELVRRADEVQASVVRARDGLDRAGS